MKKIRQIHFYLGVLFAPSILFFAFTGAFQTFRWNETGALGAFTPVAAQMASIHKNAALESGEKRRPPRPEAARGERKEAGGDKEAGGGDEEKAGEDGARRSSLPLKIYIFLMSLGLITSTATGVVMAFKYNRDRCVLWALLVAGMVLPLLLLFL